MFENQATDSEGSFDFFLIKRSKIKLRIDLDGFGDREDCFFGQLRFRLARNISRKSQRSI
jgi:hypothetical protein